MPFVRPIVRSLSPQTLVDPGPAVLSAQILPTLPALSHTDCLEESVPYWDEIILPSNYSSTVGNILVPTVTFLGDALDASTRLNAGQSVGYIITVMDDAGSTPLVFTLGPDTVFASVPSQVTNLIATAGDTQTSLAWGAPASDGGAEITNYLIEVNVHGTGWTTLANSTGATATYTHTGLTNGTVYQYRVTAENEIGLGSVSGAASATPTAGSDTIAPVLSGTSFDDSTKTILFTVSEPCTLIACTHQATDPAEADGLGGWSQATVETFAQPITGSGSFAVAVINETVDRISYYARDAAGNDSAELITHTVTFPVGAFVDTFARANEALSANINWSIFGGAGLNVVSNQAVSTTSGQNANRYTGIVADDQYIEATVASTDTQWVYLRATDFENCIAIQLRPDSNVRVYNRLAGDNGTNLQTISFSTPKTAGDVYRVEVSGTTVTVSKNGIDPTTVDVGPTYTSGGLGIGVGGAFAGFRSVEIGDL